MANYYKLNSKKHKEITATLLNTDDNDEPLDVPVPLPPIAEYLKRTLYHCQIDSFKHTLKLKHTRCISLVRKQKCVKDPSPAKVGHFYLAVQSMEGQAMWQLTKTYMWKGDVRWWLTVILNPTTEYNFADMLLILLNVYFFFDFDNFIQTTG